MRYGVALLLQLLTTSKTSAGQPGMELEKRTTNNYKSEFSTHQCISATMMVFVIF